MRYQELNENRPAYLFHGTFMWALLNIIHEDSLDKGQHWGRDNELDGVRLSRDIRAASLFANSDDGYSDGGILVLDQEKLRQQHKLQPYNDVDGGGNSWGASEAEEVAITHAIKPLSNYLVKIICPAQAIRAAITDASYAKANGMIEDIDESVKQLYALLNHPKRVDK